MSRDEVKNKIAFLLKLANVRSSEFEVYDSEYGLSLKLENINLSQNLDIFQQSAFDDIESMVLNGNKLTQLPRFPKGLRSLQIINNPLTAIDSDILKTLRDLEILSIIRGNFIEIDLSILPKLLYVEIRYSSLKTIDISNNLRLKHLFLTYNQLETIEVNHLSNLVNLDVEGNNLRKLDVQHLDHLEMLYWRFNKIDELLVTKGYLLHELYAPRKERYRRACDCDHDHRDELLSFFKRTGYQLPELLIEWMRLRDEKV